MVLSRVGAAIRALEVFLAATIVGWLIQLPFEHTMTDAGYGILDFERASASRAARIVTAWSGSPGAAASARMQLLLDFAFIAAYVGAVACGCWYLWRCFAYGREDRQTRGWPRRLVAGSLGIVTATAVGAGGCDVAENVQLLRALNGAHVSGRTFADLKFILIAAAAGITLLAVVATLFTRSVRREWATAHGRLIDWAKGGPAEPPPVILDSFPDPPGTDVAPGTARKTLAICCSGGGIRSASFNLGVLQVLMRKGIYQKSSIISAVSGGSYTASALAIARAKSDDGALTEQAPAFAPGSPEERRLRTHMHYLLPDLRVGTVGLLSLLFGFATNLGVIIAVGYAAGRAIGFCLHTWAGPTGFGSATASLHFTTWLWASCVALPGIALVGYVFAEKVFPMYHSLGRPPRGRDRGRKAATANEQVASGHLLRQPWSRAFRAWGFRLLAVGATGAVVLLAVPATIAGLNNLATHNNPTTTVAGIISNLGFTSKAGCTDGATNDFENQVSQAGLAATLQSPVPKSAVINYGACGQTFTQRVGVNSHITQDPLFEKKGNPYGGEGTAPRAGIWGALLAILALIKTTVGRLLGSGSAPKEETKTRTRGALSRLPQIIRGYLAPWAGTLIAIGLLLLIVLRSVEFGMVRGASFTGLWHIMAIFGGVLLLPLVTDANRTSLHSIYRERLATVFAVRRTRDGHAEQVPYEQPLLWSQLASPDDQTNPGTAGPELVICATANVDDVGLVPPGHGGAPFAFTHEAIGIGSLTPRLWASAADYEAVAGPGALTIPASVAISGAAVSPVMGRMTKRPVRFLLGLANVRLGVWLPNPLMVPPGAADAPALRWWQKAWHQWRTPGVSCLLREMIGRNTIRYRYVYVTDGGHYDNLGLVEALRRRPGLVYVIDGSGDKPPYWTTLGHAISLARADLGAEITLDADPPMPEDGMIPSNVLTGDITYSDGTRGKLVVGKCVKVSKASYDVEVYGHDDPAFPNKSTGDQLFGDIEFESYRKFGNLTGELMTPEPTETPSNFEEIGAFLATVPGPRAPSNGATRRRRRG